MGGEPIEIGRVGAGAVAVASPAVVASEIVGTGDETLAADVPAVGRTRSVGTAAFADAVARDTGADTVRSFPVTIAGTEREAVAIAAGATTRIVGSGVGADAVALAIAVTRISGTGAGADAVAEATSAIAATSAE